MVHVCEDDKECCFYFPELKARARFKSLVKAETEENQVKTFLPCDCHFPVKESG